MAGAPADPSGLGGVDAAAIAASLAGLVAAIGSADFPQQFLKAMRAIAGVELCSVFRRDGDAAVTLLFAAGEADDPGFPMRASLDYARAYWRSDAEIARLAHSRSRKPVLVRKRAADIADPAYRAACYDRAGVRERLSVFWPGHPAFVANGYRTAHSDSFSASDMARLECYAGILMAAVERHCGHDALVGSQLSEAAVAQALMTLHCGLSTREAEISAAMILGETQDEIAHRKHLSHGSVVTYRRRAYGKLGVGNRRDLMRLHRRIVAGEAASPAAFVDSPDG